MSHIWQNIMLRRNRDTAFYKIPKEKSSHGSNGVLIFVPAVMLQTQKSPFCMRGTASQSITKKYSRLCLSKTFWVTLICGFVHMLYNAYSLYYKNLQLEHFYGHPVYNKFYYYSSFGSGLRSWAHFFVKDKKQLDYNSDSVFILLLNSSKWN